MSEAISEISLLVQAGRFDELLERAAQRLRHATSIQEIFRILDTVIFVHPDSLAAMPLLDIVRKEVSAGPVNFQLSLSFYEFRCSGFSRLADKLPPAERQRYIEGIAYLRSHPPEKESEVAATLMSGAIDPIQAGEKIMTAVLKKTPMSVVRMGDGEGRFVIPLDSMPATKSHADVIARRFWFWNSSAPTGEFWEGLRNAYRNADIRGVLSPSRVNQSYRSDIQPYIGVVNGNRFLFDSMGAGKAFDRVPNILFGTLGDEFFSRLFDAAKTVNFIGPHPNIEEVLLKKGAKAVRTVITPSDNMVPNANDRPHYPDVYNEIISMCRSGNIDGLWLVSSGAYGKIYCDEIRKANGVALDIGSLSNWWMGLKTSRTRPP